MDWMQDLENKQLLFLTKYTWALLIKDPYPYNQIAMSTVKFPR